MRRSLGVPSFLGLSAAVLIGCQEGEATTAQTLPVSGSGRPPTAAAIASIPDSRRTAITDAVARVAPAVVTVQTEVVQQVPTDPFGQFFGIRSGERVTPGIGSGFIIRDDGVIVTNAHVVAGAQRVSVALRNGTTFDARVLGADDANDLAVLKIEARDLPVAPLGRSDALLIGEWVIAIGNPFGFLIGNPEPSVTAGVLSATGRNLVARGEGEGGAYVDMLQTDASVNPGNSGGPLVNASGEVIGVNSSIYSPSGGSIGLGFAIPINRAARVVEDLLEHGAVRRPWIGVKLRIPRTASVRDGLLAGAVVGEVAPGSPAAQAGIRTGDVLIQSRDRTLRNFYDWEAELLELRVGEQVPLRVRRGSREFDTAVTVADLPEVGAPRIEVLGGIEAVTVTPAIRVERQLRSPRGALVVAVTPQVQDAIGLATFDVIVQIGRTPITTAEQVGQAIDFYSRRGPVSMLIERNQQIFQTDFHVR